MVFNSIMGCVIRQLSCETLSKNSFSFSFSSGFKRNYTCVAL